MKYPDVYGPELPCCAGQTSISHFTLETENSIDQDQFRLAS
ncbi:hypothetical protein AmDm5_1562 [Acetobacter malorum]|nr:hypothetical protein AmDm5_1562 [Acetobacter malorum]